MGIRARFSFVESVVQSQGLKNGVIVASLFGGLIPALIGVNSFAVNKLSAPRRYEGFVATDTSRVAAGARTLPLASAFSADVVLEEDVVAILSRAKRAEDFGQFEGLSALLTSGSAPSGLLYLRKDEFKRVCRKARRGVPDAALDAIFDSWAKGSGFAALSTVETALSSWRSPEGEIDIGAVDRAALSGQATVLFGFAGLAAIDFIALAALAMGLQSLFPPA